MDRFVAVIRMQESGDLLKLDQDQLETVIPNIDSRVKVVNGAYRGEEATLLSVNMDKYNAEVKVETGPRVGNTISIDYEDICKIA